MALLIISWLLFFVAHSVFASTAVKSYFEKQISNQTYRLFYNFQSVLFIGLILYALLYGDNELVFGSNILSNIVGSVLIISGLYIMYAAFSQINIMAFLGFKSPNIESDGLNQTGVYAIVRHPLYWGITTALVGLFLLIPLYSILISMIMGIVYMAIGIEFEEKKLRRDFGKAYNDYTLGKKKFIPYIY